jgi:hypothetical protein
LDSAFKDAAKRLGVGPVRAKYYPYAELKHTWVRSGLTAEFKVSDYLTDAPDEVIRSLGSYLVSRAYGKDCGPDARTPYLAYAGSRNLWEPARDLYLKRAKRLSFEVNGRARNLKTVFDYVNSVYFSGRAPEPTLAWVRESPRRRLGYYFEPLRILAANRALDSETVPRYVLEFVMYHELLHHLRAGDGRVIRRIHHTRDFRQQERLFSHFDDAEAWLHRVASGRK